MKCDQIWPSKSPKTEFVCILPNLYIYPVIAITQTFMLCLENVTCVMVVTNKQLWSCKLKPPAREFDGILPNISLPMPDIYLPVIAITQTFMLCAGRKCYLCYGCYKQTTLGLLEDEMWPNMTCKSPKTEVFCLISDYLYPVIAITQTFMLCLDVTCIMVIDLPNISLPMPDDEY